VCVCLTCFSVFLMYFSFPRFCCMCVHVCVRVHVHVTVCVRVCLTCVSASCTCDVFFRLLVHLLHLQLVKYEGTQEVDAVVFERKLEKDLDGLTSQVYRESCVLQRVAACCSVLQRVAACCSVL